MAMIADELAMQGARASVAMLLALFSQNILVSAPGKSNYIGSSNGLVPPSNKPLPELMLFQFYVAIWRH